MQNSFWKLATLCGVIGVGCLAVIQVQQGLQDADNQGIDQFIDASGDNEFDEPAPNVDHSDDFGPQNEPGFNEMVVDDESAPNRERDRLSFDDIDSPFADEQAPINAAREDTFEPEPARQADYESGGLSFVEGANDAENQVVTADAVNPFESFDDPPGSRDEATAAYDDPPFGGAEANESFEDDSTGRATVRLAPLNDSSVDAAEYPGAEPDPTEPRRLFSPQQNTGFTDGDSQATPAPAPVDVAFGDNDGGVSGPAFGMDPEDDRSLPAVTPRDVAQTAGSAQDDFQVLPETDNQTPSFDQREQLPQIGSSAFDGTEPEFASSADGGFRSVQQRSEADDIDIRSREPISVLNTLEAADEPRRLQPVPGSDPTFSTDRQSAPTRVAQLSSLRPQLRIDKSAPDRATVGKAMIYHILVRNTGQSAAHDVVVEDRIPRGSRLTGTIPQAELTKGKLVWRFSEMPPNDERKISVRVVPVAEGQLGSVTTVNFKAEVSAQTTITAPKLRFELEGPQEVKVGETVVYRYRIQNDGSGEATNVLIRNMIPEGLQHPDGADLEYEVGDLEPGTSREIELKLVAAVPGDLVNQAVVTADGGVSTTAEAPVTIIGSQLTVTRRGPARRYIGRPAVFQNVVTNESTREAINAVVIEHIPPGMKFESASGNGQYKPSDRTIAWQIPRLASGENTVLQVKLVPTTSGEQRSVVQVIEDAGFESEAVMATNVEDLITLGLSISQVDGPKAVGERLRFQVRATNRGTAAATDVRLKLIVPEQFKVLAAGPAKATLLRNVVEYTPVAAIDVDDSVDFDVHLEAIGTGDVRLRAQIQSSEMQQPLSTEEAILLFDDAE